MNHSDPYSPFISVLRRTPQPLPSSSRTATTTIATVSSLSERRYFVCLSLPRRLSLRVVRLQSRHTCIRIRQRIVLLLLLVLLYVCCWSNSEIDFRSTSSHTNQNMLSILRRHTVLSFQLTPKLSLSHPRPIRNRNHNHLNPIVQIQSYQYHTRRWSLSKSSFSSFFSATTSDDEDIPSGIIASTTTAVTPKSKAKRSSPQKSVQRSVSTTTVVTDSAMAVPLIEDEEGPSAMASNTTSTKTKRNKKVVDTNDAVTVTNTTTAGTGKTTISTKKAVRPKASTPSYYTKNDRLQQASSKMNSNETISMLDAPKESVTPDGSNFSVQAHADDISTTPLSSLSYHNPLANYTGMPGMMMPSYVSPYLNTTGITLPNTTTTSSSMYDDTARNDNHFPTTTTISSSSSSSSSPPEYVVISRTPIPTTCTENDTAVNGANSHDVVLNDNSSSVTTSTKEEELLNPYDLIPPNATTGEWKIPYPKALSPSSIKEFQACPQSFLFQYILGLRQPTTTVLAKGTMCHAALERIFDIEPQDRSLSVLQNLFRTAWSEQRSSDAYRILFEEDVLVDQLQSKGIDNDNDGSQSSPVPFMQPVMERRRYLQKEKSWGQEGLALLENYWMAEDASSILRPNPVQREVWVKSNLPLVLHTADHDSSLSASILNSAATTIRPITSNQTTSVCMDGNNGDTESTTSPTSMFMDNVTQIPSTTLPRDDTMADEADNAVSTAIHFDNSNITKFLVRGIVDRLDMVQDPNNKTQISLRLIDYKSGKAPDLKYSPSMNLKIQNEAFDQLLIYALLLREANRNKVNPMPLRYLRLFYLTSIHEQKAIYWDMDLGATQEERDTLLHTVHVSLSNVYRNVCLLIDQQNFKAFHGCQRSFCYCHKCRPRFVPGTVWQPPN